MPVHQQTLQQENGRWQTTTMHYYSSSFLIGDEVGYRPNRGLLYESIINPAAAAHAYSATIATIHMTFTS